MLHRRLGPAISLVALLVLLFAVNLVASVGTHGVQWDLTEEKLYTLADGTQALLDELDEPIRLKLFYSRTAAAQIPRLRQYADRVLQLLRQYEAGSGGDVTLEQFEPRPDTEVEEWALQYGLQPVSPPGPFGGEDLYLGLVAVNELGSEEVLPFLSPQREEFLEYDITRAIAGVRQGDRKVIGVLSSLPVTGGPANPMAAMQGMPPQSPPWALVAELEQQYEVRAVATDAAAIDPEIDLVLVIHPKQLGDATRYALDQYLLSGGRLAVFVDPLNLFEQQTFPSQDFNARFQASFDSALPDLFKAWGVELVPGRIAADLDLGTQVRSGRQVVQHPAFITLGPEQCNQDEIASAGLESLLVAHAGVLRELDGDRPAGLTHTALLTTGPRAGAVDAMMLKFGTDPDQLRRDVKPDDAPLTLAMKISGRFTTAFPDGAPAADGEEPPGDGAHLAESSQESTVLVVADADLLTDDLSVRRQNLFGTTLLMLLNDNLAFLGNSVEVLAGGQALAGLRTRGKSERPFTLVDRLEREADERWRGTEAELLAKQQETNRRLQELERGKDAESRALLSPSQVEEIQNFREELAANKKKLREVRRNLRQDIENLGFRLKLINIGLVPALVLLAGFGPLLWRHFRSGRG